MLGLVGVGLYASTRYLDARGRPEGLEDLDAHTLIVGESGTDAQDFARAHGVDADRLAFRLRTDNHHARFSAMRAGAGITACHHWHAARMPEAERVLAMVEVTRLPVFLVAHDDLPRSRRLRAVFGFLQTRLKEAVRD